MLVFRSAPNAVGTARKIREKTTALLETCKLGAGIGIHTGPLVEGLLGSREVKAYDIIGDTVNTASRLESIADPNQILIGENTYEIVKDNFNIKKIGQKKVKGKRQAINVYEVLD